MGNQSSKVASRAASAAKRSYPSPTAANSNTITSNTAPSPAPQPPQPSAQVHPSSPSSSTKSSHIELDARDPHFASSLSRAGRAQRIPQPPSSNSPKTSPTTSFPTSSQPPHLQQAPSGQNIFPTQGRAGNPALQIVAARERVARQWEAEQEGMGRKGFEGRTLLSAREIREVLKAVEAGKGTEELERGVRLRRGLVDGWGAREGVVESA